MSSKVATGIPPVVKTVTVNCDAEQAFLYFTRDFAKWWPVQTHSCIAFASDFKDAPESCELEPRVGGRLLERSRAGEEIVWGTVLEWDPPSGLAFTFHPGREVQTAQTVEVTFETVEAGTKVVLTHGGWENAGAEGAKQRESYNGGWEGVFVEAFTRYAHAAQA